MEVKQVPMHEIDACLNDLIDRMQDLEIEVSRKADEVVNIQILQRREEIEELELKVDRLEKEVRQLSKNEKVINIPKREPSQVVENEETRQPFKRWVMSMFSFLL